MRRCVYTHWCDTRYLLGLRYREHIDIQIRHLLSNIRHWFHILLFYNQLHSFLGHLKIQTIIIYGAAITGTMPYIGEDFLMCVWN